MKAGKHQTLLLYTLSVIGSGAGFMVQMLVSGFWSTAFSQDVTFYSINLAFYFLALGIGTRLSQLLEPKLSHLAALVVALSSWCGLSIAFLRWGIFRFNQATLLALLTVAVAGVLAGAVLPLTLGIGKDDIRLNLGRLFFLDYLAAIAFTLVFTFGLLVPLGYGGTALAVCYFSLFALVALLLGTGTRLSKSLWVGILIAVALPYPLSLWAKRLSELPAGARGAKILYSKQSHYQKIVLTESVGGPESLLPGVVQHSLYLDGFIQFSSGSEQLYHFCIANLPIAAARFNQHPAKRVLILGGGDGLAARNLLAIPGIQTIDMVELDPAMVELARTHPRLREYNRNALADPRVNVLIEDAFTWIGRTGNTYDFILIDFPSPKNLALARLFSAEFYRRVLERLSPHGFISIQAGPYHDLDDRGKIAGIPAGIEKTIQAVGAFAWVYFTPRDADAFVLATRDPDFSMGAFAKQSTVLGGKSLTGVCTFESEAKRPPSEINTLNTLPLAAEALRWYRRAEGSGFFYYSSYFGVFLPD